MITVHNPPGPCSTWGMARIDIIGLAVVSVLTQVLAQSYDDHCNRIIEINRQAAQLQREGDTEGARGLIPEAEQAYNTARKMEASNPQSVFNIATFMTNVQEYDWALTYWNEAKELTKDQPSLQAFCNERVQFVQYAQASIARDTFYHKGQGDVSMAFKFSERQLGLYAHPEAMFARATFAVLLAEVEGEGIVDVAEQMFAESQTAGYRAYRGFRKAHDHTCEQEGLVSHFTEAVEDISADTGVDLLGGEGYGSVLQARAIASDDVYEVDLRFQASPVHIYRLKNMAISGNDAVILGAADDCRVFVPHQYVSVLDNVPALEVWSSSRNPEFYEPYKSGKIPPIHPVRRFSRLALAVGYASGAYYHFLHETLPKLLLLRPLLAADPDMRVLVPHDASSNQFVGELLSLALPDAAGQIVDFPPGANTVRFVADELIVPHWASPSGHAKHTLSPPAILRMVRDEFAIESEGLRNLIVYCSRAATSMRRLKEDKELVEALQGVAQGTNTELLVFDGGALSVREAIRIFSRARVVVGVHGGALANIVFAQTGTAVVELGFKTPYAQHYAHASLALGLSYHPLRLCPDQRSIGKATVSLTCDEGADGVQDVANTVRGILSGTVATSEGEGERHTEL